MDINALKALLASGQITQDDLRNMSMSGSMGQDQAPPQNALNMNPSAFGMSDADRMAGRQAQTPDGPVWSPKFGDLDHELVRADGQPLSQQEQLYRDALLTGAGDSGASDRLGAYLKAQIQPSSQDLRQQGANFVRNESSGQTIFLGPNGQPSDRPTYGSTIGQAQPQGQPSMMKVIGTGGGTRADLGMAQAPDQVNIDYSQPPMQLFGGAKAYYSKDEPGVAYVMKDGRPTTKVMLGYDQQGTMQLQKSQMDMAKGAADIAHTQEQTRASKVNNPDFSSMGADGTPMGPQVANPAAQGASQAPAQTVVGPDGLPVAQRNDAFLQTLPPTIASQVKAYAEGRLPIPAGFALKSPYFQNMMRLVGQYDPQFDFVNAGARNKTYTSFKAGPDAANIAALNTAIMHLGSLADAYGQLDNTRIPAYNTVANALGEQLGNPKIQENIAEVNGKAQAVAEELAKVFRSQGMSESEVNAWKSKIETNSAPATTAGTIKGALDLMDGRLQALTDKYNAGMGTTATPMQFIKPEPMKVLQRLRGGNSAPSPQSQDQGSAQAPNATQAASADPTDPRVIIAPDGSKHRFPTTQAAMAFRQAISH